MPVPPAKVSFPLPARKDGPATGWKTRRNLVRIVYPPVKFQGGVGISVRRRSLGRHVSPFSFLLSLPPTDNGPFRFVTIVFLMSS